MLSNFTIAGHTAIVLNLITIAILGFLVTLGIVSLLLVRFGSRINEYAFVPRQLLLWLCVISPWVIGGLTMFIFTPFIQNADFFPWALDIAHWHHPDVFELISWHGACLLLFSLWVLNLIKSGTKQFLDNSKYVSLLQSLAHQEAPNVYILDTDSPSAFTTTYLKSGLQSAVLISKGLLSQLSDIEKQIVIQHELAHLQNNDPLKQWLFVLLSKCFPKSIARNLRELMNLTMEQNADAQVIKLRFSATEVAQTLVKATRITHAWREKSDANLASTPQLTLFFGIHAIEQRVRYLVGDNSYKSFPMIWTAAIIVTITIITTSTVDTLHHLIEHFIIH